MKSSSSYGMWALFGCFAAVACAGKHLNDVGEVNDAGAGGEIGSAAGKAGNGGGGTLTGGTGGTGGQAGEPPIVEEDGGAGGLADPGFVCDECELIAETPDIRDVWVEGDRVYWIEYGSFDALKNYREDGRLMALPLEGGESSIMADDLPGPTRLRVTQDHAYVIVDRSSAVGGSLQLAQVDLDSGETRLLQALPDDLDGNPTLGGGTAKTRDWFRHLFTAGGGAVFWRNRESIYRLVEGSPESPELVITLGEEWLYMLVHADESLLYLYYGESLETRPVAGGQATPLASAFRASSLTPVGEYFYGLTREDSVGYVGRLPKTGGTFQSVAETTPWVTGWRTDGQSYAADFGCGRYFDTSDQSCRLGEARIDDDTPPRVVATSPFWKDEDLETQYYWRAWDATSTAIFIGYEDQLYRVARQY